MRMRMVGIIQRDATTRMERAMELRHRMRWRTRQSTPWGIQAYKFEWTVMVASIIVDWLAHITLALDRVIVSLNGDPF